MVEIEISQESDSKAQWNVDYRFIGLSPQYWAYTTLLICDVIGLPLINGVDCMATPFVQAPDCNAIPDTTSPHTPWQILPLSRVLLQGIITAVDPRPNGCILFVLDDGTGSIDCRCWDNSYNSDASYILPELGSQNDKLYSRERLRFAVGDLVEVMGKMKSMTAGTIHPYKKIENDQSHSQDIRLGCIREVHASSVYLIDQGRTNSSNKWNGEIVHWLRCMKFSSRVHRRDIKCGSNLLPALGSTIAASILCEDGSSDFTPGERMGSGIALEKRCCQTHSHFRRTLFYCHCEATLEPLDSSFRYRDALLHHLLNMETELEHKSQSEHVSSIEDCMDLFTAEADACPPPLMFTFESIYKNDKLASIARDCVASTISPDANAQKLIQMTFAAMTNDGLISLFDPTADLYLFVSVERIIRPYILNSSRSNAEASIGRAPFFVRSIPKKRMTKIMNSFY